MVYPDFGSPTFTAKSECFTVSRVIDKTNVDFISTVADDIAMALDRELKRKRDG
jgi:hypothetical protein